jgi:predicted metal-dependent phosphoesterase TrpH
VAIADHNSIAGTEEARRVAHEGLILVPAMEITTEEGHILAYNISEKVDRDLSVAETIDRVHAQGGMAVAAHPYRLRTGIGENVVRDNKFDAVEGMNARSTSKGNRKAVELADSLGLPITGGSDAHRVENIGRGVTIVPADCSDVDELLKSIRDHQTTVEGKSRGRKQSIAYATKVVGNWAGRGFKKI